MMMGFRGSQFGPVMNAMVSCRYLWLFQCISVVMAMGI
jgi:hypothetical protein